MTTSIGGHIKHLYEDLNLRFRDIKNIFRLIGNSEIEAFEKIDGQNLFITWDFDEDKLKVARNQDNIKQRGLDQYGLKLKFGDRPNVMNSFVEAYNILSKSISTLKHNIKCEIFGSTGGIWFPIEIINPDFPNTIHYDEKSIVFHKHYPTLFGIDGKPITTALPRNLNVLCNVIPKLNDNLNTDWQIYGPTKINVKPIDESSITNSCDDISNLCKKSKIDDSYTIRLFLYKRLMEDMSRFPMIEKQLKEKIAKKICKYPNSMRMNEIIDGLDNFSKDQLDTMYKSEIDIKNKLLSSVERCVQKFACNLLYNTHSKFIIDPLKESSRIKSEFERCCNIIRKSDNPKWKKLGLDIFPKVRYGNIGIEGLVFVYNGNLYKLTGDFAPMNRIIATVKYSDLEKKKNKTNSSLAYYISAG